MEWVGTWTVIFRCYRCARKFTLRHLTFERIEELHAVIPCPFCRARPIAQPPPRASESKAHLLVELTDDLETVYRKNRNGDTWHFSPSCSHWPVDDFLALDAAPSAESLCNECATKSSHSNS